ncbi:HEATR9 [Sigmodon hispidus]
MAPVHLPLSCCKWPKEAFPPSPECWRMHPSRPNATPCFHDKKPDIFIHWHTLNDQRKARESQRMFWKRRNLPRYFKDSAQLKNLHVSISNLTLKPKLGTGSLDPTKDPLKWQRLKELTNSLKSPREEEQLYAAYALGHLGINNKFVIEALWQVAQAGSAKVKNEAYRTLAILGCFNEAVIQALIKQLTGKNQNKRIETLVGLRTALNSWAAVPNSKKRPEVGNEEELVPVLQKLISKSLNEVSLEAALCLGFLRPSNSMVQEFLLLYLCQGPMPQRMKALRMLVKMMNVHSATVTRAILEQLHSDILDDRFEATQMLKTIGLEKIQAQGLEELTFDLLKKKIHNEPFLAMRQAVSETAEVLKMKPLIMKLMEAQLMSPDASDRQEAIISLGALGIRNQQVFHLLLDMLDAEETQAVKKSIQETLLVWASSNPWIQKKLQNKVFFVYDIPKSTKVEPTRFRKEPEDLDDICIKDFRHAKLSPLFIAKSCNKLGKKQEAPAFSFYFSKPRKKRPEATGPWEPKIREQLRNLVRPQNRFGFWA